MASIIADQPFCKNIIEQSVSLLGKIKLHRLSDLCPSLGYAPLIASQYQDGHLDWLAEEERTAPAQQLVCY